MTLQLKRLLVVGWAFGMSLCQGGPPAGKAPEKGILSSTVWLPLPEQPIRNAASMDLYYVPFSYSSVAALAPWQLRGGHRTHHYGTTAIQRLLPNLSRSLRSSQYKRLARLDYSVHYGLRVYDKAGKVLLEVLLAGLDGDLEEGFLQGQPARFRGRFADTVLALSMADTGQMRRLYRFEMDALSDREKVALKRNASNHRQKRRATPVRRRPRARQ